MMHIVTAARAAVFSLCLLVFGGGSALASDEIGRGAAPTWVTPIALTAADATTSTDGLRILLLDMQYHAEGDQESHYLRTRSVALSPQALAVVGNVSLVWSPATQDVVVHHVNIVRGEETIDVLASQSFETLRREENLEQAMLDGRLTALLQPSGLRTGDIVDVAYTITTRDPVVGGHAEMAVDLNLPMAIDQMRFGASWPASKSVRLRAGQDWTALPVRRRDGLSSVEIRRDDVQPTTVPADVPGRLLQANLIELSDYSDWADISATLRPLFDRARRLDEGSPLHAEIARIRALSDDPAVQAAAALRLVQDQVRYVALLMGEGALTPATADETWSRRFGDCKGKTALLLALLDGLGIQADPAAVSLFQGDGMDQRLPMVSAFDHVIVRTNVGGEVYWLDGTRSGDRALADIQVPAFHWALPLTADARLVPLNAGPSVLPDSEITYDFDASEGIRTPAKVSVRTLVRGAPAAALYGQISLVPAAQKDQFLRQNWTALLGDPTITEVGSAYDPETSVLTLTMTGTMDLNWTSEGLTPPGSTYATLSTEPRAEGPYRDAPYAVAYPLYTTQTTTVRLPNGGRGFRVAGGVFDRTELGYHLNRTVALEDDLVTIRFSMRSVVDEISRAEADAARTAAATRPRDVPRVIASVDYEATDADVASLDEKTPTTSGEWLDRALALSNARDYPGAVEAAAKAIELDPESSSAWANRGVYRFWTGDLEGAASDLDKATDIDPSERIAMNGNALLAMAQRRYQDAVVELSRALRQVPGDSFALRTRAAAYLSLNQTDRALRDIETLAAAQPGNTGVQLMKAEALHRADRRDEADALMTAVADANPEDETVLIAQAQLKMRQDRFQDAADIADRLIARSPDDILSPQLIRIEASLALGDLDRASADLAVVREAHSRSSGVLNNLCWTVAMSGSLLDQALRDCDAALSLQPDSAAILDSRGRVLLQMGDAAGALAAYDQALAKSPDLPASLYGRGLARAALGSVAEGEADKAAAIAISPEVVDSFKSYQQAGQ